MRKKIILILFIFVITTVISYSQIKNPDKPSKGLWDLKMKKQWEIENIGEMPIGTIQNVKIGEDGRVYLIDQKNFKIGIYKQSGKFIRSFGRQGEGPGEIKRFFGGNQLFITKNNLIIMDRSRVHYFSLEGKYRKTIKIPSNINIKEIISDTLYISALSIARDPKKKESEIFLYNTENKIKKLITKFNPFKKSTDTKSSGGNTTTVAITIGDITPLMILGYSNKTLYYGMNSTYNINCYDFKTKKTNSFSISDRKPKLVSKEYKNELKKELNDVPPDMLKNIINNLPDHASFFYRIFLDPNSRNIYLIISDPDSDHKKQIDVFNKKGEFIYSTFIKIDKESTINLINLKNKSLYLVILDEEGNEKLVKYYIELPE